LLEDGGQRFKVRVDIVEVGKVLGGDVLQDHESVEIGRRQIGFGAGKDRVKILGQPRVFLRTSTHTHIGFEISSTFSLLTYVMNLMYVYLTPY